MGKIPVRHLKDNDLVESFNIRKVKPLLSGKALVHDLHRHDFFFVLIVNSGRGVHNIDFTSYSVKDYSVFFLRPGQVHQLMLKNGSDGYLIEFSREFYTSRDKNSKDLLRRASRKNYCQLSSNSFKKIISVLNYIFQEYEDKKERYKEVIKANLEIFFIELIRQNSKFEESVNDKSQYVQERLEELLELFDSHIIANKQVSHYAELLNLTTYQLNSITKEALGKTCSELIDEHIILESKRNLLTTANLVNQIAYELGYEDVSYFIRYFKKHTGYSPEAFRQKFK